MLSRIEHACALSSCLLHSRGTVRFAGSLWPRGRGTVAQFPCALATQGFCA
jgi:hypothetical protein